MLLVAIVVVVRFLAGSSDCVRCRKTDVGSLVECSLYILHAHGADTSLATGTTQRRHLTNGCRWIRLSVAVPSEKIEWGCCSNEMVKDN